MCSKLRVVVATCLLPTGKMSFGKKLLISKRNRKRKNAVKVVADVVHTAKLETENHLRRRKRERLVLMAADMSVYKSTVYNTKGTT
jgi:hypothetical protein